MNTQAIRETLMNGARLTGRTFTKPDDDWYPCAVIVASLSWHRLSAALPTMHSLMGRLVTGREAPASFSVAKSCSLTNVEASVAVQTRTQDVALYLQHGES